MDRILERGTVLAGGTYHYDGHATPSDFVCTYRSSNDHGQFKISRPGGTSAQQIA